MPQTQFCHLRGKTVKTFDLEIYKVNSAPLQLFFAFFPCFICQHLSPSLKKTNYSLPSYCLFKLACPPHSLPHSIPSTVSARGLKARLVHCFTSETVCVFVSSGSLGLWNERDRERGGETTYGVYDECQRGQYMFSVIMGVGWILEDTLNVTHTYTHTHTFWQSLSDLCSLTNASEG